MSIKIGDMGQDKVCDNCDYYSEKVSGTDWSSGKCFRDYKVEKKLNYVKSSDVCHKWIEATLYDGDGIAYKVLSR